MQNTDTFLEHYGILGMRWGHRKQEPVSQPNYNSSRATSVATNPVQTQYAQSQIDRRAAAKKRSTVIKIVGGVLAVSAGAAAVAYLANNKTVQAKGKAFVASVIKNRDMVVNSKATSIAKKAISKIRKKPAASPAAIQPIIRRGNAAAKTVITRQRHVTNKVIRRKAPVVNNGKSAVNKVLKDKGSSSILNLGPTPNTTAEQARRVREAYDRWM